MKISTAGQAGLRRRLPCQKAKNFPIFLQSIGIFCIFAANMSKIQREKQTVRKMIELYCRHHLKQDTMPDEFQHLVEFACRRLDHCKYGEQKTACKNCPTHCYAPKEREQIRKIMRWAGPRMLFYSPVEAIKHFLYK